MNKNSPVRITALWAFSEAFLGGMLHGLKIPFTGLVLAFIASICITLIAMADTRRGVILKATLAVIAVKFALSPYTPPMAYIAVLVQGLAGELFFLQRRFIKPAAFILAVFSLMYSAFQFLITMTVLFGKKGWQALDEFLNNTTKSLIPSAQHYSLYLVLIYLACYLIAGIAAGIISIKIIEQARSGKAVVIPGLDVFTSEEFNSSSSHKKNKAVAPWKIVIGLCSFIILLVSYLPAIQYFFSGQKKIYAIFLRAVLILLTWLYFLSPLLIKLIARWTEKYRNRNSALFGQVINLLPEIRNIVQYSWQSTKTNSRLVHIKKFITTAIWLTAFYEPDHHTNRPGTLG